MHHHEKIIADSFSLDHATAIDRHWDVIIIGTGMSGATLGYELARAGKQVLFCEKGKSLLRPEIGLRGNYAETFSNQPTATDARHSDTLLKAGRYSETISDISGHQPHHMTPFIGCGTGGSSALYGAALERFFPNDFTPRKNHPHATDSTLPDEWPISYNEMLPFYERAERLYRVRGTPDPCRPDIEDGHFFPPPPLCSATQELNDQFTENRLHPYRLPQACEFVPNCKGCQGFLCPNNCKNDSVRMCLLPALEEHGARLLEECEALRLEANTERVTGVVCNFQNQEITLRGAIIILAAGALETPRLLLNSASKDWPRGLANDSDLVGRNLMRHYIDLYALLPRSRKDHPGNLKELAFNDFYQSGDQKFGTVQSFGQLPPAQIIVEEMETELHQWLVPFFKLGKPLLRHFLERMFTPRILFASIMEDLPYMENRIMVPDKAKLTPENRLLMQYRITPHEKRRIDMFRKSVSEAFKPYKVMLIKQANNNQRLAHACGTCRFGSDPKNSVLNATNRAHRLDNLYIVDASFFPSSAGTNPALTLAANALRVADHILGK